MFPSKPQPLASRREIALGAALHGQRDGRGAGVSSQREYLVFEAALKREAGFAGGVGKRHADGGRVEITGGARHLIAVLAALGLARLRSGGVERGRHAVWLMREQRGHRHPQRHVDALLSAPNGQRAGPASGVEVGVIERQAKVETCGSRQQQEEEAKMRGMRSGRLNRAPALLGIALRGWAAAKLRLEMPPDDVPDEVEGQEDQRDARQPDSDIDDLAVGDAIDQRADHPGNKSHKEKQAASGAAHQPFVALAAFGGRWRSGNGRGWHRWPAVLGGRPKAAGHLAILWGRGRRWIGRLGRGVSLARAAISAKS